MRCRQAKELLSLYAVGELDPTAHAAVEEHVADCVSCGEGLMHLKALLAEVDEALASVPESDTLERRIMTAVAATPLPKRVRSYHVPRVPEAEDEREHVMRKRTTAQLVLAAAVILLLVVIWQVMPRRGVIAEPATERLGFDVTVYNDDLALVRDRRRLTNLELGVNQVRFDGVPARIDATSVSFRSETDPEGTTVLDQNYEYDLATPDKILAKHVDRHVEMVTKTGTLKTGYLAGHDDEQIIVTHEPPEFRDGKPSPMSTVLTRGTSMVSRRELAAVRFDQLPEGLLTKPTLVWKVNARKAGNHEMVVSYLTSGLKWHCNYVLVKRPGNKADLKAWVTIENRSGASYPKAKLKLMAGDVHRVRPRLVEKIERDEDGVAEDEGGPGGGFTEKAFFEYHLYTLGRETDLFDNSTKQIELSAARDVGTTTQYVLEGGPKVAVYLKFKNAEANGLGVPMPKGVVRVMQEDTDGSLEFIGEDGIDHTPKDEEVKVLIGNAFDLVGERRVLSDRTVGRSRRATIEVKLRNHKATPVTITVRERLSNNWRITKTSHDYRKEDARTVEFDVPVAPNTESVLTFSYDATW